MGTLSTFRCALLGGSWVVMKWGYKSLDLGYNYSYATYNYNPTPTYNYPQTLTPTPPKKKKTIEPFTGTL